MSLFFHEQLYRTQEMMRKIEKIKVAICGAGAIGANMVETLARSGFTKLRIIDRDRVEERNLSTQPYFRSDVGAYKAKIMANMLFRALKVTIDAQAEELTDKNVSRLLNGAELVIDAFDNSIARKIVTDHSLNSKLPCLHIGLVGGYAEVIWNEIYRTPSAAQDDICDYPLARNLVMLSVAVAGETVFRFVTKGEKESFTITLEDFAIKPFIGPFSG